MTTDTTIIDRLRHYLNERRNMRGLDPDVVHAVHSQLDEPRHAELRLSDLSALLDALTAAHAARDEALGICRGLQDVALGRVTPFAVVRAEAMEVSSLRAQLTAALRERDEARAAQPPTPKL